MGFTIEAFDRDGGEVYRESAEAFREARPRALYILSDEFRRSAELAEPLARVIIRDFMGSIVFDKSPARPRVVTVSAASLRAELAAVLARFNVEIDIDFDAGVLQFMERNGGNVVQFDTFPLGAAELAAG